MKIVVLIENHEGKCGTVCEHGLSVYVETETHRILVDTGASGAFLDNARLLSIDLSQVDTCIISHGHYDHAGGVMKFSEVNKTAPIYIRRTATGEFMNAAGDNIGIDGRIPDLPTVNFVDGDLVIDDTLELFTNITGREYFPAGNKTLKVKTNGKWENDRFDHEQCAVIREGNETLLISGCAHNGIINILAKYREKYGSYPTYCLSGFHMMKHDGYTETDVEIITKTAEALKAIPTKFFTGHCTHDEPFEIMKQIMGEQVV